MIEQKYKTQPFRVFPKAKELRQNFYSRYARAGDEGVITTTGSIMSFRPVIAGIGDFIHLGGEPYGAVIGSDPVMAQQFTEATESRGYARDMCGYMRNYLGSMFMNKYAFGGPFKKPTFVFQVHFCEHHGKWYQIVQETLDVPVKVIEFPVGPPDDGRHQARVDYLLSQLQEAIPWMEKVTGRKYDDERLIQALQNFFTTESLWGEIMLLNRNIPAPIDIKTLYAFQIPSTLFPHERACVDFHKELLDEMKYRVKEGIAAVPVERARLMHDNQPPWYFLDLFRFMEQFGAVVVISHYVLFLGGTVRESPGGGFERQPTPMEMGVKMTNRDEALRALVEWSLRRLTWRIGISNLADEKRELEVKLAKEWKIDAAIMHLNRGCEMIASNEKEVRLALMEAGFPVVTYEGNMADKREFDEGQTMRRITAFMESMNLKKIAA